MVILKTKSEIIRSLISVIGCVSMTANQNQQISDAIHYIQMISKNYDELLKFHSSGERISKLDEVINEWAKINKSPSKFGVK